MWHEASEVDRPSPASPVPRVNRRIIRGGDARRTDDSLGVIVRAAQLKCGTTRHDECLSSVCRGQRHVPRVVGTHYLWAGLRAIAVCVYGRPLHEERKCSLGQSRVAHWLLPRCGPCMRHTQCQAEERPHELDRISQGV